MQSPEPNYPTLTEGDDPWTEDEKKILAFFSNPKTHLELSQELANKYGRAVLAGAFQGVNSLPFAEDTKDLLAPFFADFMSAGFLLGYKIAKED